MAEGTRDYAVGYGKPPAHSRFAKGRSGNPNGRPRGKSLAALLRAALDEPVTVEISGRRRRLTKGEAILASLVDGAVAAEPRSTRLLLQFALKLEGSGALRDPEDDIDEAEAEEAREFLIQEFDRLAAEVAEEDDDENSRALERLAEEEAAARARRAAAMAEAAPKDAA
jgi:hypothetical protein